VSILVACGLKREARIFERAGFVAIAGGGDRAALEAALERAVVAGGIEAIWSAGIGGALDPTLKPGDLVIGTLFSRESGSPEPQAPSPATLDPRLRGGAVGRLATLLPQARVGTVIGCDTIAATVAEKRALRETGAIAVDMESHIAACVAERHALPFAILRAISDGADHVLPPAALVGMNPDGSMALGAVLASLARNPRQLRALIRTGRDAEAAFRALERAFAQLHPTVLAAD
jgi:hopanoid-associated phosphorylase